MKTRAMTLVENIARAVLKENTLDSSDAKLIGEMVSALSQIPYVGYRTNDIYLKKKYDELRGIRMEIMQYLEDNSNYEFVAHGNKWKLKKK